MEREDSKVLLAGLRKMNSEEEMHFELVEYVFGTAERQIDFIENTDQTDEDICKFIDSLDDKGYKHLRNHVGL